MNAATLKKRLGFGSAMILLLGGLFYFDFRTQLFHWDGGIVTLILTTLLVVGVLEMRKLIRSAGYDILPTTTIAAVILLAVLALLKRHGNDWGPSFNSAIWRIPVTPIILAVLFLEQMLRHRTEQAIQHVMASLLTVGYIGLLGAALLTVRLNYGCSIFIAFLLIVKSADIGAFFVGSAIGKHKLIPSISPKKSWEGLYGGLAFSTLAAIGAHAALKHFATGQTDGPLVQIPEVAYFTQAPLWAILVLGLSLGLIGQFGDWCESLLKRSAGAKDSASLIPEFGGVLDLLDSPLIAAPFFPLLFDILINPRAYTF